MTAEIWRRNSMCSTEKAAVMTGRLPSSRWSEEAVDNLEQPRPRQRAFADTVVPLYCCMDDMDRLRTWARASLTLLPRRRLSWLVLMCQFYDGRSPSVRH